MIKASGKTGLGQPLLFLGISGENVTRLVAGEPIRIKAEELAALGLPPMMIGIHYGKTEQAILDEMREHGISVTPAGSP
jgi:hypothetical protein